MTRASLVIALIPRLHTEWKNIALPENCQYLKGDCYDMIWCMTQCTIPCIHFLGWHFNPATQSFSTNTYTLHMHFERIESNLGKLPVHWISICDLRAKQWWSCFSLKVGWDLTCSPNEDTQYGKWMDGWMSLRCKTYGSMWIVFFPPFPFNSQEKKKKQSFLKCT